MTDDNKPRGRRMFVVLAALFFAPLVAAYVLYFAFPQWQPQAKVHHGQLIAPALPLPPLQLHDAQGRALDAAVLKRKWSLLYLGAESCEQPCQDKLFQIRQIRTLLNQNRDRVQRVYAAPNAETLAAARATLAALHPDLVYVDAAGSGLREFLQPQDAQAVYLLDPLGNWLMVYPESSDYQGILKDLKKLLRLSQIG